MTVFTRISFATLAIVATASAAAAQSIAIIGGKVYPVSGPAIEHGTVLIRDGKIVAVGAGVPIPADAKRIDATGKWVTPGLVNAATQFGLFDVGFGAGSSDVSARGSGNGLTPSFTAWEGVNPNSVYLAPARDEGITSVLTAPGGGMIGGQAAMLDLVDGTVGDMLIKAPVAMVGTLDDPSAGKLGARAEMFAKLRELIEDTKAFMRHRADFERNGTRPFAVGRVDLEAMIPVVEGRVPLALQVNRESDIDAALRLAKQYSLKLIIIGAAEGWRMAPRIAQAKIPVMAGAMNNIPSTFNSLGQRQETPGMLRKAGVDVAIIGNAGGGDEEQFNIRNIRQEAGNAVAYGMSWDDALRAVTLTPAELFGVADKIGSLRAGREANVVVWSADPFEFGTRAEHVLIRGKEIADQTRQDELTNRYRTLPPNYKKP
ncbi:MAG: amidohydrolase family protein [Gemmatimonadota bacterium]|nr:amidohydrolase family protein [Gemmatimonadota bacterium]